MPDHPRSRGEYAPDENGGTWGLGSSPLSRGIQPGTSAAPTRAGIIPALAGILAVPPAAPDSSGIIPALAGNTVRGKAPSHAARDHPRSRGEYCPRSDSRPRGRGSSPLSRGILQNVPINDLGCRIIPALAGNTHGGPKGEYRGRDHPRSRGEYTGSAGAAWLEEGSSPLSRGIRNDGYVRQCQ